ncbi:MAG: crossover junction endodeoxyribonuclease RuvC [Bacteroidales bacterium]|jgi:crossover junction endodeoxyribonuclease RuvC|nr:crossover junction endodeoxyribonuclease RuvC [Bacteroidales bacterium]
MQLSQPPNEQIILGIDPGTNVLGYSVIALCGKKITLLEMDVLKLDKEELSTKMKVIFDFILAQIERYKPDILAVEAPFFGKNVQSLLKLGRSQGLCIAAALSRGVPFVEYPPRRIKQAVTGNGAASKEQVAAMLRRMIGFEGEIKYLDATDALAVAVCCAFQKDIEPMETPSKKTKTKSSWAAFASAHPQRVKQ